MKELNITGPDGPFYRTKCQCLRICSGGPICVVYPEGTWYRDVTPENAERIIQEARAHGALVSKKVDGQHVLDRAPFDPQVEEYQIVAPIAGG